jgi:hypothetical protein
VTYIKQLSHADLGEGDSPFGITLRNELLEGCVVEDVSFGSTGRLVVTAPQDPQLPCHAQVFRDDGSLACDTRHGDELVVVIMSQEVMLAGEERVPYTSEGVVGVRVRRRLGRGWKPLDPETGAVRE